VRVLEAFLIATGCVAPLVWSLFVQRLFVRIDDERRQFRPSKPPLDYSI
jgi:hypothetical protein